MVGRNSTMFQLFSTYETRIHKNRVPVDDVLYFILTLFKILLRL